MIKYENVAAERAFFYPFYCNLSEILAKYDLKTVQDVIDLREQIRGREDEIKEIDWKGLDAQLAVLTRSMRLCNKNGKDPASYETVEYEDSRLNYTDSLNNGNILLLTSPTSSFRTKYRALDSLTMTKIKTYLRLTMENGNNYLECKCRNIGSLSIPNILEAINLYNDQVLRQSEITKSRDINLFMYQKDEKYRLAKENYIDIIDYLLDTTEEELVWGKLSDNQRKIYLSTIDNRSETDKKIKKRIIDNISNYTTLDELEQVNRGHYKVLNRFIRK